jgi:hypothetical protein
MTFARPEAEAQDVVVESVFIVDSGGEEAKIVFYLANQDIMQVLKERGIVPD